MTSVKHGKSNKKNATAFKFNELKAKKSIRERKRKMRHQTDKQGDQAMAYMQTKEGIDGIAREEQEYNDGKDLTDRQQRYADRYE